MAKVRSVEVVAPVGEGKVVFERLTGGDALGRPFEYDVDILSPNADLPISKAVGKRMTVTLDLGDETPRFFNGVVARFSLVGWTGDSYRYRAKVRPWLWLLSRSSNNRIFQSKNVVDVLRQIFDEHGYSGDVDAGGLDQGSYKPIEYLVQYRETDFNFVSRLMEQAGIFYWFKHEQEKHTLVLADGPSHEKVPGYEEIPFFSGDSSGADRIGHEHISSWSIGMQVEPGTFTAKEYDFEKPRAPLLSKLGDPKAGSTAKLEMYEYPGLYIETDQRDAYVARRLVEQQLPSELVTAGGNARGIRPGACFKLTDYPSHEQNREYLVTAASYVLSTNAYASGAGDAGEDFLCTFFAIESQSPFRSPLTTPKPTVSGPQTAKVVGPGGEEIWTDKYGRVKVQFHWDREGKSDEKSSCWVRVSQAWAGPTWGAMHIPRIGQEVIVDFLEGDPDRPIITGRVYNADNMPPYALPGNKTQSGIKSRSSLGGSPSNFNEIRFEDKKGSEQVYIQAEKNQDNLVKADDTLTVGANRTKSIGIDETVTVGGNRTETVSKNETETVTLNQSIDVGVNQTLKVGANQTITVGANRSLTVSANQTETIAIASAETVGAAKALTIGAAYQVSVGAAMNETIGGLKAQEIGAAKTVNVGGPSSENVGGNKSVTAGGNIAEKAGGDVAVSAGKNASVTAGADLMAKAAKNGTIDAGDELTLKCGDATIVLKKNGDITIKGKKIVIDGSGDVLIKGTKIGMN
jgi:type VI secretion system secreted protein VgrG